jgi:hypothetical protein
VVQFQPQVNKYYKIKNQIFVFLIFFKIIFTEEGE